MDAIITRRSCRKFEDRPVEREKIESLLRAAMQAPSGKDARPWQFLVLTERASCEVVSKTCDFSVSAAKAPAVILLLADFSREEKEELWWPQALSAAAENILLQAECEGLGATWLGVWPVPERVAYLREQFRIPEQLEPFAAITVGYKLREKPADNRWDPSLVHWESL